jgi:membrane protein
VRARARAWAGLLAGRARTLADTVGGRLRTHRVGRFAIELVRSSGRNDLPGVAAEMAFRFTFALAPLLLLLMAIASAAQRLLQRDLAAQLMVALAHVVPSQVTEPLQSITTQVLAGNPLGIGVVGLVGALWGGSGAARTLMKGLNRAYGVSSRTFWRQLVVGVLATLLLPVLAVGGIGVYLVSGDVLGPVADLLGASSATMAVWRSARWPLVLLSVTGSLWLMYRYLPNVHQGWVASLPGALAASLGWLVLARGFQLYLQHLAGIPAAVGSLGLGMVVLAWLYAVGLVLLLGAEVNAAARRSAFTDDGRRAQAPPAG